MSYLAILGNTPKLSALELGQDWTGGQVVMVEQQPDLARLGGTVKVAETWLTLPRQLNGIERIHAELERMVTSGKKLSFGFSVYAGSAEISTTDIKQYTHTLQRLGLEWKKQLRADGHSVRFVVSREPALSSVIVTREHLLKPPTDFIIVVRAADIVVGRTLAVQDYHDFSKRDYGRPGRNHLAGMLPPKVARMIVNIAQPATQARLLDPFCGSGTILQEALTLGYHHVSGVDIAPKAIADTKKNLVWLKLPSATLYIHDALQLETIIPPSSVDAIITEGYLGPIRTRHIANIQRDLTSFYTSVWRSFAKILKPGGRVVMALPAWKQAHGTITLPLTRIIPSNHFRAWHEPILYGREQASVLRQIVFLEKRA